MEKILQKSIDRYSSKTVAGLFLVSLGLVLIFLGAKERFGIFISKSFIEEPIEAVGFEESVEEEFPPSRIVIQDLKIDLPVRKAKVIDGYWEVFPDVAGWGEGTGVPGKSGNIVIFAHARWGLFLPLRKAKQGMEVVITGSDKEFRYDITEIQEVYPDDVRVISPTPDETLTLYTCSGFADSKRLIVTAKRII